MALAEGIAALGTRVEESSDVTNMRSSFFSSVALPNFRPAFRKAKNASNLWKALRKRFLRRLSQGEIMQIGADFKLFINTVLKVHVLETKNLPKRRSNTLCP